MEDDQQFCLRWNNHQSTLIAVFDTLLENGTLVDCTLAAEGKYLNAHKVVLSACSPYFESLLSQNYDKHPIFILKDVKFQELKAMMDYMYRGEVNISQDQLSALLRAAESLQIKGLSDNRGKSSGAATGSSAASDTGDHPTPAKKQAIMQQSKQQQQLPNKGQGLTITEPRRMNKTEQQQQIAPDDRDGSVSPGPSRRRKRARRKSTDTEDHLNHHDGASNSSESHQSGSTSAMMTAATTTMTSASNKAGTDVPAPIDTKADILAQAAAAQARTNEQPASSSTVVPNLILKEKQEPAGTSATSASSAASSNIISHAEVMLEPKSEYIDDMNEDSIEDLTLDDDDLSNMEGQMEDGAGPSQGHGHGESSQDPFFGLLQPTVTSMSALSFARNNTPPIRHVNKRLPRVTKIKTSDDIKLTSSTRIIRKPKRYITEIDDQSSNHSEDFDRLDFSLVTHCIDPLAQSTPNPLIPILNTFAIDQSTIHGAQYDVDILMFGLGSSMRKYAPETVRWALDAVLNRGASVTAASRASGIKRTSLHLYLKKLNIRKIRYDGGETLINSNTGENISGALFSGETSGGLIIEEVKADPLDLSEDPGEFLLNN